MAKKKKRAKGERGERAQETETRILDAAEQVFARVGYAGATTQTISEEAGITKAMIHAGQGEDSAALIEALGSAAIAASEDRAEGVAAFQQKRTPDFPGT